MSDRFDDFALRLRDTDNVAVAKRPLAAGFSLNGSISLTTDREIPAGHKIACSGSYLDSRFVAPAVARMPRFPIGD